MDASLVDSLMSDYEQNGYVDIPSELREKVLLASIYFGKHNK